MVVTPSRHAQKSLGVELMAAALFIPAALPTLFDTVHHGAPLPSLTARGLGTRGGLLARLGSLAPAGHGEYRTAQHDEEAHHAEPDLLGDHSCHEERDTYEEARDRL